MPPIPSSFQGDWMNVANETRRLKLCRQLAENAHMPIPKIYALTFTEQTVEHRYIANGQPIFVNEFKLRYSIFNANHIIGKSEQEYQKWGTETEFPVRFNLPFAYTIDNHVIHTSFA